MEDIKNLLTRFRQLGVLLFIGLLLIIYISFGFVYWQQSIEQKDLEEQNTKISDIVAKPLASKEKLKAEYDEVNLSLSPMTASDAIAIIVGIAEKSGIDVTPGSNNLTVPSAAVREETVGEGTYRIFSFQNVIVRGDYDSVMAFISDLDSGTTQETMVLKSLAINQIEIEVEVEEATEGEEDETTEGEEEVEISTRIEANATLDVDLYTKL